MLPEGGLTTPAAELVFNSARGPSVLNGPRMSATWRFMGSQKQGDKYPEQSYQRTIAITLLIDTREPPSRVWGSGFYSLRVRALEGAPLWQ